MSPASHDQTEKQQLIFKTKLRKKHNPNKLCLFSHLTSGDQWVYRYILLNGKML